MAKKSKKKFLQGKLIYALIATNFVLTLLVGFSLWAFTSYRTSDYERPREISLFIDRALSELTEEAGTTPSNTTQYIPEVRLKFTRSSEQHHIAYFYSPAYKYDQADIPETVVITSTELKAAAINRLYSQATHDALINEIPKAQNCSKIFVLSYDKYGVNEYHGNYDIVDFVEFSDSSPLYIWENQDEMCFSAGDNGYRDELLQILKTAKHY